MEDSLDIDCAEGVMATNEPIPGRWYWVRGRDWEGWSVAVRTPVDGWNAAGDWGNLDTWEDFDREIVEWKLIPLPEELP